MLFNTALRTGPGAEGREGREGRRFKVPLSHGLILQLQASLIPPFRPAVPTHGQGKCYYRPGLWWKTQLFCFGGEEGAGSGAGMQQTLNCSARTGPGPRVGGETMLRKETQAGWAVRHRHRQRKRRRITRGQGWGTLWSRQTERSNWEDIRTICKPE